MKSTPSHRGFRPDRRGFLRALGGSAALLPLFESRFAQGAAVPRRLVLMNTTNGVLADSFFPKGDGSNLADLTLPTCTAPLNDWKSKVIVLGGLSLRNFLDYGDHGAGHENFSCLFTGAKGHEVNCRDAGKSAAFRA